MHKSAMGSFLSLPVFRFLKAKKANIIPKETALQRLVRPSIYAGAKRPSFAAAYARAARRYKFNIGVFPTWAYRKDTNAVFRVLDVDNIDDGTEVPADSIQNGKSLSHLSQCLRLIPV